MKHKQDAIDNSTRLIDLHRAEGLSFNLAAKSALITAQESRSRNDSLTQRTINHLREVIYGPETAQLIHDKESELQKAYGHRGFEFVEPEDTDDMTDDEYEKEYDRQQAAYKQKIKDLKKEIEELYKLKLV